MPTPRTQARIDEAYLVSLYIKTKNPTIKSQLDWLKRYIERKGY